MAQPIKILDVRPAVAKFKKGMNLRSSPSATGIRIGSVGTQNYYRVYYWAIVSPEEFWLGLCPDKTKWVCWLNSKETFVSFILMDTEEAAAELHPVNIIC